MERVFLLHPRGYFELCDESDPFVARVRAGEIRVAGTVIAVPAMPAAWMPGRFFALIDDQAAAAAERLGAVGSKWAEVTGQVDIDLERGLRACPEGLRQRYRGVALEAAAIPPPAKHENCDCGSCRPWTT